MIPIGLRSCENFGFNCAHLFLSLLNLVLLLFMSSRIRPRTNNVGGVIEKKRSDELSLFLSKLVVCAWSRKHKKWVMKKKKNLLFREREIIFFVSMKKKRIKNSS